MTQVIDKLRELDNSKLIQLAHELRQTTVPEDALIRDVIKGTELDTTVPLLAFIGVGAMLAQVFAERLETVEKLMLNLLNNLNEEKKR